MHRLLLILTLAATLVAPLARGQTNDNLPPSAIALDSDLIWDVANPHAFAISPDTKQIAYISKGAIWICAVDAGPPPKLVDLPGTVTAILVRPENEKVRAQAAEMPYTAGYRPFSGPRNVIQRNVFSLTWTPNQEGVTYVIGQRVAENSPVVSYHVRHASASGADNEIAVIEGDFGVPSENQFSFHVTASARFVVVSSYGATLIWDVSANFPRVSSFDYLLPSTTSGRFLGVEIDTRQLVLVDENFEVAERFDVTFPASRLIRLFWSEDERYAICCTYREYDSRQWDGFRINLKSGEMGPNYTGVAIDRFVFTGHDDEVIRLGVEPVRDGGYADGTDGSFIAVTPSGARQEQVIHGFSGLSRRPKNWRDVRPHPETLSTKDGTLFAMALPRPKSPLAGFHFHLIGRDGKLSPFAPIDDAAYQPIAFADGDQRLIARKGAVLFSIPLSDVAAQDEHKNE